MAPLNFSNMCDRIAANILDTFTTDGTKEEQFVLTFKHLQTCQMLPFESGAQAGADKSGWLSQEFRIKGNTLFTICKTRFGEAIAQYNRSIACAPYPVSEEDGGGMELALAVGNRSLVLFTMNMPEACLSDIQLALDCNYPQRLRYKLYHRQGKCYQMLGKTEEANKSFQKGMDLLTPATQLYRQMKAAMSKIEAFQEDTSLSEKKSATVEGHTAKVPVVSYQEHGQVPGASSCVDVKFRAESGRFIEANRDIQPGDVLIVEEPYAAVLLPDYYYTHCYKCFKRSYGLIPCKCCSQVMYCSSRCRDVSWNDFHRYECPLLPKLLEIDMGLDWVLALRTLLVTSNRCGGIRNVVQMVRDLEHSRSATPETDSAAQLKRDTVDPFRTIHNLSRHRDHRSSKEACRLAVMAACVVNGLDECTDLMSDDEAEPDLQLFCFVGGLLLQYLESLPCNCYTVADLVMTPEKELKTECFGVAVYATASYLNHSCDPNTLRSNRGGVGIKVMASQPIKKGEQVFCDYGLTYHLHPLETRQTHLQKNYFFSCKCDACVEDWPEDYIMEQADPVFLCSKCNAPLLDAAGTVAVCGQCSRKHSLASLRTELQMIIQTFVRIKVLLLEGLRMDFSRELAGLLSILNRIVERPNKAIIDAVDALGHNDMQAGNFYILR